MLERNTAYWGKKPEWDKVIFRPIKAGPSRVAALLAGDVDMIEAVPSVDLARLKKDPKVSVNQTTSNRVIYLHLDHWRDDSPFVKAKDGGPIKNPLRDLRVRQALSKLIDRDSIVSHVMEDDAIKAGQLLPEGFFGVSDKLKPVAFDPSGAKKLLEAAGVGGGFQLTIHGPNDRYPNDAKIAEAVGQMLTRGGIDTKVATMTRSVFFRDATTGGADKTPKFSFILVGWGSGTGEASSPLKSLLMSYDREKGYGGANRGRYSNAEVDKLTIEALSTVDDTRRAALLAKATEIAINDVGIIPLHYQINTWATRRRASSTRRARTSTPRRWTHTRATEHCHGRRLRPWTLHAGSERESDVGIHHPAVVAGDRRRAGDVVDRVRRHQRGRRPGAYPGLGRDDPAGNRGIRASARTRPAAARAIFRVPVERPAGQSRQFLRPRRAGAQADSAAHARDAGTCPGGYADCGTVSAFRWACTPGCGRKRRSAGPSWPVRFSAFRCRPSGSD